MGKSQPKPPRPNINWRNENQSDLENRTLPGKRISQIGLEDYIPFLGLIRYKRRNNSIDDYPRDNEIQSEIDRNVISLEFINVAYSAITVLAIAIGTYELGQYFK